MSFPSYKIPKQIPWSTIGPPPPIFSVTRQGREKFVALIHSFEGKDKDIVQLILRRVEIKVKRSVLLDYTVAIFLFKF
jgi:hypothetical protein